MMATHPQYPNAPWVRAPLRINKDLVTQIFQEAEDAYPSECCGFLFGPTDDVGLLNNASPQPNEADKYHAMDPETFPRTSRTYFKINELRASRTLESAAKSGQPLKVIYHSHCDAGAYFSKEDADTFSQSAQLMWPCAFVVVSVKNGIAGDTKLWIHVPGTNEFEQGELTVE
jgi:proteasome lid subunit RPN8/RPN11